MYLSVIAYIIKKLLISVIRHIIMVAFNKDFFTF